MPPAAKVPRPEGSRRAQGSALSSVGPPARGRGRDTRVGRVPSRKGMCGDLGGLAPCGSAGRPWGRKALLHHDQQPSRPLLAQAPGTPATAHRAPWWPAVGPHLLLDPGAPRPPRLTGEACPLPFGHKMRIDVLREAARLPRGPNSRLHGVWRDIPGPSPVPDSRRGERGLLVGTVVTDGTRSRETEDVGPRNGRLSAKTQQFL